MAHHKSLESICFHEFCIPGSFSKFDELSLWCDLFSLRTNSNEISI